MKTVTVEEARTNLPDLLRRIAAGEELIITESGKWVGLLAPPPEPPTEEEMEAHRLTPKEAVRALFCQLKSRQPVLDDGTRIQDYLDRMEMDATTDATLSRSAAAAGVPIYTP